ncbi:MAG TPA: 1,4-alpha-glucan branching protein domain-containing protein [Candidatus Limnocylindria bacterium]|nr:1,4-alpha-glucan branching protein domain-containing protein [Candidatus Limnocylindria bacterium]
MTDAFALVLHSHLPYARGAGRWPHGEEWVHEAILGTYLPLLGLLHDLRASDVSYRVTIGLTPTLLEQLADADIDHRFIEYCDDQIRRAEQDLRRFGGNGDTERGALAMFYLSLFRAHREAYGHRFGRDIVGAFADLARTGHVEILTSGATHGYLPLLDPASVHAQLAVGLRTTRRRTGVEPRGIWLPECAYAPGLEDILESFGITHFFTDAALFGTRRLVERGHRFESRRSGDAIDAPLVAGGEVDVLRPYLVRASSVAALARHDTVSGQVWSAQMGYPGDASYREFHRKDERSGLRYWRVTDVRVGLAGKGTYSPGAASERVRSHADHFVRLVRETLAARPDRTRSALLTVTFDAELFGHWWFEGIDWLGRVLRELSARGPRPVTVAEHLRSDPARERVALQEGSWGKNNDHSTWVNAQTQWMWTELARMSEEMADLRASVATGPLRERAARQAARELLLAQSSDWPFLVTTGQAADYAIERFRSHALRFRRSIELARRGGASDEIELRSLERADNPFVDASVADFGVGALTAGAR